MFFDGALDPDGGILTPDLDQPGLGGKDRTPLTMIVPPAILVVAAIVVGLMGQIGPTVQAAAVRFEDQAGYNATVLNGAHHPPGGSVRRRAYRRDGR